MKHRRPFIVAAIASLAAAATAAPAQAQSEPAPAGESSTKIMLGLGAAYMPRYAGSDEYKGVALPVINVVTPWGGFIDSDEGIGYRRVFGEKFIASAALGYDPGRKDSNERLKPGSDKLKGMGEVKGAALLNLSLGYRITQNLTISAGASQPLSNRDRGRNYYAKVDATVLTMPKDSLAVAGSAHFGSADYNQSYFGVTANQSANSGFATYTPGSGLYALKAGITWTHRFDENWSLLAATEATRYMTKAGDSPIVKARTNYGTMAAVNYTF
ncbi:MipA/OmpV family protein [Herbaspirillum sp. RV1423]|uniref:MipA/OmpV family protein n=1 Tax=Herbaspirillum sp. RV1423 TaxID=1443993 RepID=UPI0004B99DE5|nr:MipA/OmpV family protein [Herbaspirillum sp. RV1423]